MNDESKKLYFTYNDDETNSHKFWWITTDAVKRSITTGWGRIGTPGQTKTKECPKDDKTLFAFDTYVSSLINSKRDKGYVLEE